MNIETYFKQIKDFSKLPNGTYGGLYTIIVDVFESQILPEIKAKMVELEKEGYYNDHGIEHIKMVIDRVSKLIEVFKENDKNFALTDYEIYLLLISIYLHDSGHLIAKRKEHTNKVHETLTKFFNLQLTSAEKRTIGDIAKAHGGKDDPIGKLVDGHISGFEIRSKLLAAILRLADELAEDKTRASLGLLKLEDDCPIEKRNTHINKYSEIYHRFSQCLDSMIIQGNEIKISFCVSKKLLTKIFEMKNEDTIIERYLLDEIYSRTYKTFLETLYCNRFFPANSRFNVIKIKIDILEEYSQVYKTISYELVEKGYPTTEAIGSLINEQIEENGVILNGEYFANMLKVENEVQEVPVPEKSA